MPGVYYWGSDVKRYKVTELQVAKLRDLIADAISSCESDYLHGCLVGIDAQVADMFGAEATP
jgi:hypothetical protein